MVVAVMAVALLALSSSGVVVSAAGGRKVKGAGGRVRERRGLSSSRSKSKFIPFKPKRYGNKRNYEVACDNEDYYPDCYLTCPANYPNSCIISCDQCDSLCQCDLFPGTSCGDPRFTGDDGNTFYFHGKKDQDFCIVSDADLHINAHFIGNHNPELKRDFTWVQALGISFGDHHLYIGARKAVEWDEEEDHIQIIFDGELVNIEEIKKAHWASKALSALSVTRMAAVNNINVELNNVFSISAGAMPITEEHDRIHKYDKMKGDSLVHLDLGFQFHNLTKYVDGVLGQTYRPNYVTKVDITAKMPIMGGAPKYLSSGLFSTDCAVSKFHRRVGAGDVITTSAS